MFTLILVYKLADFQLMVANLHCFLILLLLAIENQESHLTGVVESVVIPFEDQVAFGCPSEPVLYGRVDKTVARESSVRL